MSDARLSRPDPVTFRYAVYACSSKLDLSHAPDPAVALFEHRPIAETFGRIMWPTTFEIVDIAELAQ